MIEQLSLWIIAIAVCYLAYSVGRGKLTGPPGPAGPKGDRGEPGRDAIQPEASASSERTLCRVLRKTPNGWAPNDWVRKGSRAYQQALDTPGFAVSAGDEIDYGNQA